jgi:hypothetical protein
MVSLLNGEASIKADSKIAYEANRRAVDVPDIVPLALSENVERALFPAETFSALAICFAPEVKD